MDSKKLADIALIVVTAKEKKVIHCELAQNFFARAKGLLFRKPLEKNQGLLLTPCASIHTLGLTQAIDVIFCKNDPFCKRKALKFLACHTAVKPWRFARCTQAQHTLELPTGEITRLGLKPGQTAEITHDFFKYAERL